MTNYSDTCQSNISKANFVDIHFMLKFLNVLNFSDSDLIFRRGIVFVYYNMSGETQMIAVIALRRRFLL